MSKMAVVMITLVSIAYVAAMIWFTINFPWVVGAGIGILLCLAKTAPYDYQLWDEETIRKYT